MAQLLKNGSIKMLNGRILWGRENIQIIDLCELTELLCPPSKTSASGRIGAAGGGFGGFGGGGGRGPAGPQGPSGAGVQGPQGPSGGGGGAQGPQGNQGNQGPAGGGGGAQGPQGFQGNQGFQGALNPDIFAATRVVSLAGDGTDLTIAAAIAALPAEGGYIYIKQGIYPIAASLVPTNKPIVFLGSGDGTILNLGANVISAFTISFNQSYSFGRFRVLGSGVAGQAAFQFAIGGAMTEKVVISDVLVENIEKPIVSGVSDFPLVHTTDCLFRVANLASSFHWDGPGDWHSVNTICSFTGVVPRGGINGAPTIEFSGCTMFATNGVTIGDDSVMQGCAFIGAAGETVTLGARTKATGTRFEALLVDVAGDRCEFSACAFPGTFAQTRVMDITAPATGPLITACLFSGCATDQIRVGVIDTVIEGCHFFDNGTLVRAIDVLFLAFRTIINGNNFEFMDEAVQIASANCVVTDNVGCKVVEVGSANVNVYSDNTGFDPSTIIGAASRIENENVLSPIGVDTTLDEFMRTVPVDASGGNRTETLPSAASAKWRKYTIKKVDATANTVTIDAAGAETIDGALTVTLTVQWQSVTIQSDGSTWYIV